MKMYSLLVAAFLLLCVSALAAATVPLPNGSFEGPDTPFADPRIDSWQDYPKPAWYDELTNGPWDYLTGVFENTGPAESNHIHNIDGTQAAFFFAYPQVGIFQDYNSVDWAHLLPGHEFNALYHPGKAYQLTVGLIGGGGNMREGVSIATALYYRDASSNMVFVAMTNVVHSLALFPDTTNFVDIPLITPLVKASDAWANQNIGVAIFSTVGFELAGGYWDIDNVRLQEIDRPRVRTTRVGEVIVESEPGQNFDILASSNLNTPFASWPVVGHVENVTGTATFQDPSTSKGPRFYIARYATSSVRENPGQVAE
jgi:hypothetical protein